MKDQAPTLKTHGPRGCNLPTPVTVPAGKVKKSLESDYPRPKAGALRPIHGFATAISDTRPTHAFIPVHRTGHPAYSSERRKLGARRCESAVGWFIDSS